jgi:hypothetical protein
MQLLKWIFDEKKNCWELITKGRKFPAATVYNNGVWHTWDESGVGGENSTEESVQIAKIESSASAIMQGFI